MACEGRRHEVRWVDGEVVLGAHPDVDAELAFVALGGVEPRCVELVSLWRDAVADGGFIGEWAEYDGVPHARRQWLSSALERLQREGVKDFLHDLSLPRAAQMGRFLTEFPAPFVERAAIAVAEAGDPAVEHHVQEATKRRLRSAFVESLMAVRSFVGTPALVPVSCRVLETGSPAIEGRLAGRSSQVALSVTRDWLVDVWAAQRSLVNGALVLGADKSRVLAVKWEPSGDGLVPKTELVREASLLAE